MQFNPTTGSQGITHDVWFLTGTDSTSFPIADLVRIANKVMHRLGLLAWKSANSWKFDDSNKTDLPIATTNLVDNQEDYTIPTTTFDIKGVDVQDSNGNWVKLKYITKADMGGTAKDEFQKTKGMPIYYLLEGNSIRLKPAPSSDNVTLTSGLKIHMARNITEFTVSTTTTEPGFPTPLHPLISAEIALEYAGINGLSDKLEYLSAKVGEGRQAFIDYYANRGGEIKTKITTRSINYE